MIRLCHTHEWVMSCVWVSHVTHEWVMSHRWMRHTHMFHISSVHVTHTDGSCHSYKWVISRVWLCDVVHVNWSRRHTHEWGTLTCSINDEVMSHTWMRHTYMFYKWWGHVTHINWVMSHISWVMSRVWRSDVLHMNSSRHTYDCGILTGSMDNQVTSHIWMNHVTRINESCHTDGWVMSHIWMSHVTQMDESCHTCEWVMSHRWLSHVTQMNESCHTHEWVKCTCS